MNINIRILLLSMLILCISCSTKKVEHPYMTSNDDLILTDEFQINDTVFYQLLLNSKKVYNDKHGQEAKIIVVDFYRKNGDLRLSIKNCAYLYTDQSLKLFFNEDFKGVCEIGKTLVLLKGNLENEHDLITFKKNRISIKVDYGLDINYCQEVFKIKKHKFLYITTFCSSDVKY